VQYSFQATDGDKANLLKGGLRAISMERDQTSDAVKSTKLRSCW
jgi:hypothetical protein